MINRRLVLIFNDGGKSNNLAGVSKDRDALLEYFYSAEGGAWEKSETQVYFNDCTKNILREHINFWRNAASIKYWVIVFSGHGYATSSDTYLELSSDDCCGIKEIQQMLYGNKCLLIADSCRVLLEEAVEDSSKTIERLFSSQTGTAYYRSKCKQIYDKAWESVNLNSFNTAFAASFGQAANDDSQKGAYYIEALLDEAKSHINSTSLLYGNRIKPIEYASFAFVHTAASKRVASKSFGEQQPAISGIGMNKIPFVVTPNL